MTIQEMNGYDYKNLISLSSFLINEYAGKNTIISHESLNMILHEHNVCIITSDLSASDSVFVIEKFGEWYTVNIDQQLNDQTYLNFVYCFVISYISLNSNLIFYHYKQKEFKNIIFKHGDTFDTYYNSYAFACMLSVPPLDQLAVIIQNHTDRQSNTINLSMIADELIVDINVLRNAAKFYKLII